MDNIEFVDEYIAKKLKESNILEMYNDNLKKLLEEGYVIIKDEKIKLEKKEIIKDLVTMLLPKNFEIMDKELAKIKYPNESRAEYIYTNEEGDINFTFSYFNDEVATEKDIQKAKEVYKKLILKMNPSVKIGEDSILKSEEKNIYYFEFISPSLDVEIYNILFTINVDERLLLGTFNCTIEDKYALDKIAKTLIQSVEINNK